MRSIRLRVSLVIAALLVLAAACAVRQVPVPSASPSPPAVLGAVTALPISSATGVRLQPSAPAAMTAASSTITPESVQPKPSLTHPDYANRLAWLSGGQSLAAGTMGGLRIYDPTSGSQQALLPTSGLCCVS